MKRNSPAIKKANTRAASLTAIDPALDLGKTLTLANYKQTIKATQENLDTYNTLLSETDAALTKLEKSETVLSDLSDLMLKGVATNFGSSSAEYEKAGGTRKDQVRRSTRKAKISRIAA